MHQTMHEAARGSRQGLLRTRWAAIGAAVAVSLGAGGVSLSQAAISTGEKPVFVSLAAPCRVADTRPASTIGSKSTPVAAGDANAYSIAITGGKGQCTGTLAIPSTAVGVALNVTAIAPNAPAGRSFFTVYPGDASRPGTSNLNFLSGQAPVPNKVDVGLSPTGTIKVYNDNGTAHVAVDVFGYYVDHTHDDRYYTESESNSRYYTKAQVNSLLAAKANQSTTYTKDEIDAFLDASATIATGATPGSANVTAGNSSVIASATLVAPVAGDIVALGLSSATPTAATASCSLSTTTGMDAGSTQQTTVTEQLTPVSGFSVVASATVSVNLVCASSGGSTAFANGSIRLIFFPADA